MDKDYVVSSIKIGDWVVQVIETIDDHNGEVMDREFLCTSDDMREPFHSLVEAIEFARSITGRTALCSWSYVVIMANQAHQFNIEKGWAV